ncbi:MAG: polyprenyl synthetase family protein [Clostridiales bacterium]|nr:polyprenyl synthetase family protein [Clostridiales bacterium]
MNQTIKEEINKRVEKINGILEEYLPKEQGGQKIVLEAMNYSVRVGGKRIRPMLLEETYRYFTKNTGELSSEEMQVLAPFMVAMEMIHTYSLVHDDLPAMDGDEYRRGKLTTWKKYGEAVAVLAGDGLLNYAYETAAKAWKNHTDSGKITLSSILKAYELLTVKPGISGMIGGQAIDVENCGEELTLAMLDHINELKTGALMEASMMIGAALAGADEEKLDLILKSASCLGMAFQIQDDILDRTSTTEELGKPVGSDEKNHKTTYVNLLGIEKASGQVEKLSEKAICYIKDCQGENPFLLSLVEYLIHRKK